MEWVVSLWFAEQCVHKVTFSHLVYPTTLAAFIDTATRARIIQVNLKRMASKIAKTIQVMRVMYMDHQNRRESIGLGCRFCLSSNGINNQSPKNNINSRQKIRGCHTCFDSKIQTLVPSSRISFHHRSPTRSRPVTFLTVQKSNARQRIIRTEAMTKDCEKTQSASTKMVMASDRNRKWNMSATGWLEAHLQQVMVSPCPSKHFRTKNSKSLLQKFTWTAVESSAGRLAVAAGDLPGVQRILQTPSPQRREHSRLAWDWL